MVECVLGRSLAHPHLVPSYDYGVSTLEVGCWEVTESYVFFSQACGVGVTTGLAP